MSKLFVIALIAVLMFAAVPALAQEPEATPEPTPVAEQPPADVDPFPEVPTTDVLVASLLTLVIAVVGGYASSPVTVTFVSLLKRIPGVDKVNGEVLQYGVAGLLVAVILVARQLGYADQLHGTLDFIQQAIVLVVGFASAMKSSSAVYASAVKHKFPVVGYQRAA